ncbi:MAG TPA: GNAT family N-acetyltransferase [Microthrixaceae bacterium]|jgi:RimJ/RimL family protein N-acetyltransferase|nr:GNAT family N-acetyltransferase [Microthrixaceae bacterium]HMT26550.1 GNAT family N-acetyltransferase [Microthrixaceae bacterium]HMT62705.1 GNAT family N-acetyltransferase [Microthrixaceae bacterium]
MTVPQTLDERLTAGPISLRFVQPNDIRALAELQLDSASRWKGRWRGATPSPGAVTQQIARHEGPFFVITNALDDVVGCIGAYRFRPTTGLALINLEIAPQARRTGTAAVAAGCMIDHLFEDHPIERIRIELTERTARSLRAIVVEFETEAVLHDFVAERSGRSPVYVLGIDRDAFRRRLLPLLNQVRRGRSVDSAVAELYSKVHVRHETRTTR